MTEAQKRLRELREKQSKDRQRLIELSREDALTDETRSELDALEQGQADLERQTRAAQLAVDSEDDASKVEIREGDDPETRERLELRGKASLGRYLVAAMRGRRLDGAEAELAQAAGLDDGQIPLELWDVPVERRNVETRDITPAPGTTGINLDVLRPEIFAPSIADKLMIEMPQVESGTFATGTVTGGADAADAVAKGADVPEVAHSFAVGSTGPRRVGASLNLAVEDIAAVGQANFESILRQHISLVLSDELDDQMINGDGSNDDLTGIIKRLEDILNPVDPTEVADFDAFVAAFADGIDGLWSTRMAEVAIVAGVDTYRLAAKTFRDPATGTAGGRGDEAFADYAESKTAGWWTNKRMPDAAANIQRAILCRKGRSTMPTAMRTAVCPHWGYITIDDIYTGARKGERRYVVSVLVGDVILVQPDAYALREFKVA